MQALYQFLQAAVVADGLSMAVIGSCLVHLVVAFRICAAISLVSSTTTITPWSTTSTRSWAARREACAR